MLSNINISPKIKSLSNIKSLLKLKLLCKLKSSSKIKSSTKAKKSFISLFSSFHLLTFSCSLLFTLVFSSNLAAKTIDEVKQRGYLNCGVSQSLIGFSYREKGEWSGLDVDICKAVAAAIFGNSEAVQFTPLSSQERFSSLQNKRIDILSRNTTWTYTRDTSFGITFTNVTYYDGQGFMARKNLGLKTIASLAGKTICCRGGTTSETNIKNYFAANKIPYKLLTFEHSDREILAAYHLGKCDVYSGDRAGLAAQREKLTAPSEHSILPEVISKEPLGPAVRYDDQHWINLVRWVTYGLITAEEYGITKENLNQQASSNNDPKVKFFLGLTGNIGEPLKLDNRFMANAIAAVGNYGEIFDRHVGPNSKLRLPRDMNKLWTNGGLMYAPPFL